MLKLFRRKEKTLTPAVAPTATKIIAEKTQHRPPTTDLSLQERLQNAESNQGGELVTLLIWAPQKNSAKANIFSERAQPPTRPM